MKVILPIIVILLIVVTTIGCIDDDDEFPNKEYRGYITDVVYTIAKHSRTTLVTFEDGMFLIFNAEYTYPDPNMPERAYAEIITYKYTNVSIIYEIKEHSNHEFLSITPI